MDLAIVSVIKGPTTALCRRRTHVVNGNGGSNGAIASGDGVRLILGDWSGLLSPRIRITSLIDGRIVALTTKNFTATYAEAGAISRFIIVILASVKGIHTRSRGTSIRPHMGCVLSAVCAAICTVTIPTVI